MKMADCIPKTYSQDEKAVFDKFQLWKINALEVL